jgi:hypothetical protein
MEGNVSCQDSKFISVLVEDHSDFGTPEIISETAESRDTTHLLVSTKDGTLMFGGTIDELLHFAAEFTRSVYSWMIVTGHSEWLGNEIETTSEGVRLYVRG